MCVCSLQTVKGAKISSAVVAAIGDGTQVVKEDDEKMKIHTHSYCCLDYAQVSWLMHFLFSFSWPTILIHLFDIVGSLLVVKSHGRCDH